MAQYVAGALFVKEAWDKLSSSGRGQHTLTLGKPGQGDMILDQQRIRKGGSVFSGQITHTFSYSGSKEITAVVAQDEWTDDTGGNAEVVSGGVGYTYVSVKVTSQFGRGFHFQFIVYGRK